MAKNRKLVSALQKNTKSKPQNNHKVKKGSKPNAALQKREKSGPFPHPFTTNDTVLLIGEGNFSFAQAILREGLVEGNKTIATCLERYDTLVQKYPEVEPILADIKTYSCNVRFEIDGTKLHKIKSIKRGMPFDMVVFNFPHVGSGMKDQDRNILENQKMLLAFFQSAIQVLSPGGKVMMTLFKNERYAEWNVKELAKICGLRVRTSRPFDWGIYPGYSHRRTAGPGGFGQDRESTVYIFEKNIGERHDTKKRKLESDSDE